MFFLDGKPLPLDVPFTDAKGQQYPANWLRLSTLEEKEAIGITEGADPEQYDQRFFWSPSLPKDHKQLVQQWCAQTRQIAGTLLAPTDWLVIRKLDNKTAIPADIKALREDIRKACQNKVTAITKTKDTPELASYITSSEYSTWPSLEDGTGAEEDNIEAADVVQEATPAD
jgi:hypothetical protein